jgi:DNA helicase-2/ATP-dependent DNA helicase PcrA
VQEALKRSGMLARLEGARTDEDAERAENLAELVAAAREFDESLLGEPPSTDPDEVRPPPLARFLEQIALLGEADQETPEGRVSLMTLHAAKGLEFESVFLAGLEDGTLPYERPWADDGPGEREAAQDEERRLCYVGMTRAKKRLTLSLARRRIGYGEGGPSYRGMEPSRFLADLPPELFGLAAVRLSPAPPPRGPVIRRHPGALEGEPHIEMDAPSVDYEFDQRPEVVRAAFSPGAIVAHASLGEGRVVSCEGAGGEAKVTVIFDDAGEKRVLARFLRRA